MIDLDKVVASSYTAGLKEIGDALELSTSASGNVTAGNSAHFQINFPLPPSENNVIALAKAQITGSGAASVDGYWWPIQGQVYLPAITNFLTFIIYTRTSIVLQVNFEFKNTTGITRALPSMTLTARTRFHTYPW